MQIQSRSISNETMAYISDILQPPLISGTYAEIKELRDTSKLVPGCNYKITDYVATVDNGANVRSMNHPFDLILFAESSNTFSEHAHALRHEPLDDTQEEIGMEDYFRNSKLEAWKVWYCLDNDSTRFGWANQSGKGVIYRLIDELDNDVPYDFKSIQFIPYTEENVQNAKFRYTFDSGDVRNNYDLSINSVRPVYANVIAPVYEDGVQKLNEIVFMGFCINNTIEASCNDMVITNSSSNVIKRDSWSIILTDDCHDNIIGEHCTEITLGSGCRGNLIGSYCKQITINDSSVSNIIGNNCENITFSKPRYRYITVADYNKTVTLNCTAESYGAADWYQNIIVSKFTDKVIDDSRKNQTYLTTFVDGTARVVSL